MNIKKKKIDLYYIMNIILSLLAIISFSISFIKVGKNLQTTEVIESVGIGGIANYLQFMTVNKLQVMISIALHNFVLALIAYLLSVCSCGILGSCSLCSAFFIAGLVIRTSMDMPTVIFVTLEVAGISLAVFGGTYIFNKRRKYTMPFKKITFFSLALIGCLILIYLLAAYIEANLIQNLWR